MMTKDQPPITVMRQRFSRIHDARSFCGKLRATETRNQTNDEYLSLAFYVIVDRWKKKKWYSNDSNDWTCQLYASSFDCPISFSSLPPLPDVFFSLLFFLAVFIFTIFIGPPAFCFADCLSLDNRPIEWKCFNAGSFVKRRRKLFFFFSIYRFPHFSLFWFFSIVKIRWWYRRRP